MFRILYTSTAHKTASVADEGNSAYCQSSGAQNIKHIKSMESYSTDLMLISFFYEKGQTDYFHTTSYRVFKHFDSHDIIF